MKPFLRWPGGKARLLPRLRPLLRVEHIRLVEPFVGGGSVYFDRRPAKALLADVNADLIEAYEAVRDDVDGVVAALGAYTWGDADRYYSVRDMDPGVVVALSSVERAARFIYLNRSSFHGLQRTNAKGKPNAAFGNPKPRRTSDDHHLRQCSRALQAVAFMAGDFAATLQSAQPGDLVFMDPPYLGTFSGYAAGGFDAKDHERLAAAVRELDRRDVRFLLTNADVPEIRDLYTGFRLVEMRVRYNIAGSGSARKAAHELAVMNFEPTTKVNRTSAQPTLQTAAKAVQKTRGRPGDAEVQERLGVARELLQAGTSRARILEVFRERFGLSTRSADAYLRRVREQWQVESVAVAGSAGPGVAETRQAERSMFLASLQADIAEAKLSGTWNAVAALRKLEADVRGLRVVAPAPAPAAPSVTVNNITLSPDEQRHRVQLLGRVLERQRAELGLVESSAEQIDEAESEPA